MYPTWRLIGYDNDFGLPVLYGLNYQSLLSPLFTCKVHERLPYMARLYQLQFLWQYATWNCEEFVNDLW